MYHAIVRRRAVAMFGMLGRSEWPAVVASLAGDVHHVFPGEHPLGGERNDRDAVLAWFERLGRLYPEHRFEVDRVISRGSPRNTWIAVRWRAHLRPQQGAPYTNHGVHWIHVRWGKTTAFHGYLDTQLIARSCAEMAAAGIEEAAAPPIVS